MKSDEVVFYEKTNYAGTPHTYKEGQEQTFHHPEYLNDRLKSVKVGELVQVLAWQHSDGGGKFETWDKDNPDISSIGGLSKFKVVLKSTRILAIKFVNATGNGKKYCLLVDAHAVSDGKVKSCSDDAEYKLVGTMPEGGPPVTVAIYVRDEQNMQFFPVASLYFQWNTSTHEVDIVDQENFPKWLHHDRDSANRFTISLTEIPTLD